MSINIVGNVLTLIIGVISIPLLIKFIDIERLSFLLIALAIMNYGVLFDLGFSKAVLKYVSEIQDGKSVEKFKYYLNGLICQLVVGLIITLTITLFAGNIIELIKPSDNIYNEISYSFIFVALSIPFAMMANTQIAFLQAHDEHLIINYFKFAIKIAIVTLPLLAALITQNVGDIILVLVSSKILYSLVLFIYINKKYFFGIKSKLNYIKKDIVSKLFTYGKWIAITSVVSPLFLYVDRFYLSNQFGLDELGIHIVPLEIILKLMVIPSSVAFVYFPVFSRFKGLSNEAYISSSIKVLFIVLPIVLVLNIFPQEILSMLMMDEYSSISSSILITLTIALIFNGLALIPFTYLQAKGYPEKILLSYAIELPIYIFFLFVLVNIYGVIGASLAFLARVILDFLLLSLFSYRMKNAR